MGNRKKGLYLKFRVTRADGQGRDHAKHEHCKYFVLDYSCDPFAWPALKAYADACRNEYPLLAADLDKLIEAHGDFAPGRRG